MDKPNLERNLAGEKQSNAQNLKSNLSLTKEGNTVEEEQFITNLFSKTVDYNNPELAITTANLCDTISRDINTDGQRFIYELLQNADDASNHENKLDVQIDFVGEYAIISHMGEPFSKIDIESISSAGDGTKTGDSNKTGFKGIGFKSVFSHSDFVIIKSHNYCFRYDRSYWNNYWSNKWGDKTGWQAERRAKRKDEHSRMPWQIIPIWTELPKELSNLPNFRDFNVSTIIKYDEIDKLKEDLSKLIADTQILLFLRSKEVKIKVNSNISLTVEKSNTGKTTILSKNGKLQSEWIIKTEQFDIPVDVQRKINSDEKSPRKLRDATRSEISLAVQLDQGRLKAVDDNLRLVFTYLPTSINCGFPFLVNASFLTDAGRQNLHQDVFWNNWLFEQIPMRFFEWISAIVSDVKNHGQNFLKILPQKLSSPNSLSKSFNKGFNLAISTIAFIPNESGHLLKVSEAIFDKTSISEFIDKQVLINYLNQKKQKNYSVHSFIPHYDPINILKGLGIDIFEIEELSDFFCSNIFAAEHKVNENFTLIKFLCNKSKFSRDPEDWNQKLRKLPFVFSQTAKLSKPNTLLFRKHIKVSDAAIVHSSVLSQIVNDQEVYNWLIQLGIQEPTDTAFIDLVIEEPEKHINHSNAIEVIRYIFNAYRNNSIKNSQFEELRKVKLLTKKNTLLSCEKCYLSDYYAPQLALEKKYHVDLYVSESYVEGKDDIVEWKAFFLKMKVKQQIGKYELSKLSISSLAESFGDEYFDLDKGYLSKTFEKNGGFGFGLHNQLSFVRCLSFLEQTVNDYSFARLFWNSVIVSEELTLSYLTELPTLYFGIGSGYNSLQRSVNETYFQWFIRTNDCMPTTQKTCLIPESVYLNTIETREIAGKYLPVFDCDSPISSEMKNFFNFIETLKITDYLGILVSIASDLGLDSEAQKENQKRIGAIYEKLASMSLHPTEQEKITTWGLSNKLLSKDGITFYYPKDLYIVTVEGFRASNLAYVEKQTPEIFNLMRLFGVTIIDKISPFISNDRIENKSFKNKLMHISPLLALVSVEKSKNRKEWEAEYSRICNKLSSISFFVASEISLSYGNEDDRQKRSSWADNSNFFCVGDYYSLRVLDGIVDPLSKFLGVQYAQRLLIVLLLESFLNGVEYLKEKGYDITLIPEDLLVTRNSDSSAHTQENRSYNQSDEDLGRKGEIFVYNELKQFYAKKYNSEIQETVMGFKVGTCVEVFWVNKVENTNTNHDFKILENNQETYIDSKATPSNLSTEKMPFYLSLNELTLMKEAEKYLIARVFNVTTNPSIELIALKAETLS
jgi:Domain of unknown function (DUF3883)